MATKQTEPLKNAAGSIISVVIALSFFYAILRYHIVGSVPWKDLPFFIFNKGIALSSFVLLVFNFTFGPLNNIGIKVPKSWLNSRRALGMTGFLLALIHALMSFLVFKKDVFAKFFEESGSLTLMAGLSMLGGILSFVALWAYNLSFQTHLREDKMFIKFITSRNFLLFAMLLSAVHLFFMGYKGWMQPTTWQGGLPPISLIGFALFVIAYIINLFGRK